MKNIILASTKADIKLIAQLAKTIWTEHYTPIIGTAQVNYMVSTFQSEKAIHEQLTKGVEYYLIKYNEQAVGYIGILKKDQELFLSKIYILNTFRGKKLGKLAMDFITTRAQTLNCTKIVLTVNKNNVKSITAYEKLGFINTGALVQDIGNGFVMDDYKMEKKINKPIS